MKRHILFVDDERSVLDGLRRMLRPLRHEWDMNFAESGTDALNKLRSSAFDVIVSDMRMPGMDGASLIARVQKEFPSIVRIVLSGQADRETVLRCVEPTHQYLAKPCDSERLKATVTRACALRDLLANPSLRKLVAGIDSLPSMPSVYLEITKKLRDPGTSVKLVGDLIRQDLAMSAKILKLVNSAFFGLPRAVQTPEQATNFLGIDTLKTLVLSIGVFSQFEGASLNGFSLESTMQHSLRVAQLAKSISKSIFAGEHVVSESFLAGLLHDIGKLILAQNLHEPYSAALNLARYSGMRIDKAEQQMIGCSHAEIGAYLLGLWGLSDSIVEAIAFHHEPSTFDRPTFGPLAAVHIADAIDRSAEPGQAGGTPHLLDEDFVDALGVADQIVNWQSLAFSGVSEVEL